jgi:intracellular septation protein
MNLAVIAGHAFALTILTAVALLFRRIWVDREVERRRGLNRRVAARTGDRNVRKGEVLAGTHDLGLTLIFAAAYLASPLLDLEPLFAATAVYVAANALLFVVSRNFGQGMFLVAWVSRLTIVAMGALALWWHDETFIKMNRTVYFGILAAWSIGSVLTTSPRLQRFSVRDHFKDVTAEGWRALTLFAGCACALLAAVNELVWRNFPTGFWVAFQIWGWLLAELILSPLAMPLFRQHGYVRKIKTS